MAKRPIDFTLRINAERCTGCGWCVAACPLDLLSLALKDWKKTSVIHDLAACTACAKCQQQCHFGAIEVQRPT